MGRRISAVMAWVKSNGFLAGLLGMVGLAWLLPDLGAQGGLFRSELARPIAVFLIFFIQGMALPTEDFRRGVTQLNLHSFVLSWNYLAFPLIIWIGLHWGGAFLRPELRFGFLYLAILPTTITSAVFFTSVGRGDVAGAVFSTTISNLASVFLVPMGVAMLLVDGAGSDVSIQTMFLKLCKLIILPMFIGQCLRPFLKFIFPLLKPWFKRTTTASIFFIMYCTFCDGVRRAAWEQLGWGAVAVAFVGALAILLIASALVWWTSGWLSLSPKGRVAAYFCGSQKSLATGVPMAASIFPIGGTVASIPDISVIVLPLMCYHFLQLAMATHIANRFARRSDAGPISN
ncbi:bile acid:sodium symporter [bacterium]|nr:bile acid:sodium symporter [bacterium]